MRATAIVIATLISASAAVIAVDSGGGIDPRKSLAITDHAILSRFAFSRVMKQLVAQSGVPGLTELALFQQWWDSQNPTPGHGTGARRYCDDAHVINPLTGLLTSALNEYPYDCRPDPSEGAEATSDPFTGESESPDAYLPIGLFNRFDLAPLDGAHCGEYRIVYARRSGVSDGTRRNLIIFEATLANPSPKKGLEGCYAAAKFWANLTSKSVKGRAGSLERFYFSGIPEIERDGTTVMLGPVIHVDNFGNDAARGGQVRTNQFMNATFDGVRVWTLREFKLMRTCSAGSCSGLEFVPVTVKGNPFGGLFHPTANWPEATNFAVWLTNNLDALLARDVNDIRLRTPDIFNSGQSHASGSIENRYLDQLGNDPSPLRTALETRLAEIGSSLSVNDVLLRAQSQSCAGCHRLNDNAAIGDGLTWPASLGFVHVSERLIEEGPDGARFRISDALVSAFLPRRAEILKNFMGGVRPVRSAGQRTLSGRDTH